MRRAKLSSAGRLRSAAGHADGVAGMQELGAWPMARPFPTKAPYDATQRAATGSISETAQSPTHGPRRERLGDKLRLLFVRPMTWLAFRPHRLGSQDLECSMMIHTVTHRFLRMIHAENARSAALKIRGVTYALTLEAFLLPGGFTRIRSGLPSSCSNSKAPVLRMRSLSLRKP